MRICLDHPAFCKASPNSCLKTKFLRAFSYHEYAQKKFRVHNFEEPYRKNCFHLKLSYVLKIHYTAIPETNLDSVIIN